MFMKNEGSLRRREPEQQGPRGSESSRELAAFAGLIAVAVGLGTLLVTRSILLSPLFGAGTFIVAFAVFHILRIVANSSDQYSKRE
jgi:type IV secretory pathway TrbD component